MKRLVHYLNDPDLIDAINREQEKIISDEKLSALADTMMTELYDKKDEATFLKICKNNRASVSDCFVLAVFDLHFHRLVEIYEQRNIPDDVLAATMGDFNLWADNFRVKNGRVGFDEVGWLVSHMEGHLFRLGRLQFMVHTKLEKDYPHLKLKKGDPVLDIHIPADGKMSVETCRASMNEALGFTKIHFPEHTYKAFTLDCWLLCDEVKEILPPDSSIIQFASSFTPVETKEKTHPAAYQFLFGFDKDAADFEQHEARTTFQKGAHKLLREKRWFTGRSGVICL